MMMSANLPKELEDNPIKTDRHCGQVQHECIKKTHDDPKKYWRPPSCIIVVLVFHH